MTSAKDYKSSVYDELKVSGGAIFKMRESPMRAIISFMDAAGIEMRPDESILDKLGSASVAKNMIAVITHLVPSSIVEPHVVISGATENEINIDDIKKEDLLLIIAWIMNHIKADLKGTEEINLSHPPP